MIKHNHLIMYIHISTIKRILNKNLNISYHSVSKCHPKLKTEEF